MNLWPHQERGVDDVISAIASGHRRICLTSPTGGGKTRTLAELVRWFLQQQKKVVWYTNRRLLIEQTSNAVGLPHGVRAAGHPSRPEEPFQISSVQTEAARVLRRDGLQSLHPADLVIFDEVHLQTGETAREIRRRHLAAGAVDLGVTATPLGLGDLYDTLVVAGTTSEGRACGALVPAMHFGPDEPDLRSIGRVALGEDLTESQNRKLFPMTQFVFGRVLEWWKKLNPEGKPTILFAPGVPESLWFAEQFEAAGVRAAHIDGQELWFGGATYTTSRAAREEVLEESRSGRIRVLCNRFVLREGVDAPWLAHGIFATVFGSLQSYLQSGGRLLRAFPGLDRVTVQDHGGNWWRHGSLNADRHWTLDMTPAMAAGLREERLRAKEEKEPCRCPACGLILAGTRCPCGWVVDLTRKSRPVIQSDGTIREHAGDVFKPRVTEYRNDTAYEWAKVYHRARNAKMTFRQAEALFFQEQHYWPPRDLRYMPTDRRDFYRRVDLVPKESLR